MIFHAREQPQDRVENSHVRKVHEKSTLFNVFHAKRPLSATRSVAATGINQQGSVAVGEH